MLIKKCKLCGGPMDVGRCHDCGSTTAEADLRLLDDEREPEPPRHYSGRGVDSKGDRFFGCITSRKPNV
jgi:hypothetical protein